MGNTLKNKNTFFNIFVLLLILIIISLILFPRNSLNAAKEGINLWLFTVMPALLPFFIGSELLIQLGVVHFLGTFLEPIMRPVFKVPGSGSFAMAIGYTSGYPVGAQIISRLWEENLCTTAEAERLMSFCNNSGPLFMLGAVAMGMFNSPEIGYIILISNYLGAISTGLLFRFYKKTNSIKMHKNDNILKSAFNKMYNIRNQNNKSFSNMLSDSVIKSMNTILLIGGYIVFFSVIIEFLKAYGILNFLSKLLSPLFMLMGFDKNIVPPFLSGLLEITVGTNLISQSLAPVEQKIIIASSIIAWGGISTHGQVLSIISKTKISYLPYFVAKILHCIFAAIYSYLILIFIKIPAYETTITAFQQNSYKGMFNIFQISLFIFIITSITFIITSVLIKLSCKTT